MHIIKTSKETKYFSKIKPDQRRKKGRYTPKG
jgi:hypothetical protein